MQAHPIRRQAIRRRGLAEARSAEAVAPERGVRGTYKLSPERRAKGGLGCPVSHPEHGDTLIQWAVDIRRSQVRLWPFSALTVPLPPHRTSKYLTIALAGTSARN